MDEYIQGLKTAYVDKEICEPSSLDGFCLFLCFNWLFRRENPYRPMKLYTEDLQKSPEEVNAEFEDLISSLMGPFWSVNINQPVPNFIAQCWISFIIAYKRFGTFSANCPMKLPAGAYLATVKTDPSGVEAWPIPSSVDFTQTTCVKWPIPDDHPGLLKSYPGSLISLYHFQEFKPWCCPSTCRDLDGQG